MRASITGAIACAVCLAAPLRAQNADGWRLRAFSLETGAVAPAGATPTAVFGAAAELGPESGAQLRLGVEGWTAALHGAVGTRLDHAATAGVVRRFGAARTGRFRLLLGAGLALHFYATRPASDAAKAADDMDGTSVHPGAYAEAGASLPIAFDQRLALDLRLAGTALAGTAPHAAFRVGVRIAPGRSGAGLVPGESRPQPPPAPPLDAGAEPAPAEPAAAEPPAPAAVDGATRSADAPDDRIARLAAAGGLFHPGTAHLTTEAAEALRDLGRALRARHARALDVRVVADSAPAEGVPLATARAAAVAAALTRGGYPIDRIRLSVVAPGRGAVPGSVSLRGVPDDARASIAPYEATSRVR